MATASPPVGLDYDVLMSLVDAIVDRDFDAADQLVERYTAIHGPDDAKALFRAAMTAATVPARAARMAECGTDETAAYLANGIPFPDATDPIRG